jgi:DNA-binding transcriptional regulator PaaX
MKPANIILDLLRTYRHRGTSARNIMSTAEMFGITQNLTRVTLSRLVNRGLVENVSRGHYRLAAQSDPVNSFIEEWQRGEERCRTWTTATYLVTHISEPTEKDLWTLAATGFLPIRPALWARPDNLARSGESLTEWLFQLGLSRQSLLLHNAQLDAKEQKNLISAYQIDKLLTGYRAMNDRLAQSAMTLRSRSKTEAMSESFQLGGEAIQLLAKDPYLPKTLIHTDERIALWRAMMDYDRLGRGIWADSPTMMPALLAAST